MVTRRPRSRTLCRPSAPTSCRTSILRTRSRTTYPRRLCRRWKRCWNASTPCGDKAPQLVVPEHFSCGGSPFCHSERRAQRARRNPLGSQAKCGCWVEMRPASSETREPGLTCARMQMKISPTIEETRAACRAARRAAKRIGLVPTMGALHEGHLSLVRQAKADSDFVVVSLFVNPLQFGPREDLSKYPRTFERDRDLLNQAGVDLLFAPSDAEM